MWDYCKKHDECGLGVMIYGGTAYMVGMGDV